MAAPARDPEKEYREEAERLAQLPLKDQKEVLAYIIRPADNPKLGKWDREEVRQRADALNRHLRRLNRAKKAKKPD